MKKYLAPFLMFFSLLLLSVSTLATVDEIDKKTIEPIVFTPEEGEGKEEEVIIEPEEPEELEESTFQRVVNTLKVVVNCSKEQWTAKANDD